MFRIKQKQIKLTLFSNSSELSSNSSETFSFKMPKVNYKNFKKENVVFGKTEECKTSDATGKQIVYYRIPISYRYETPRADGTMATSLGPLYIEGPIEKSRGPNKKEFDKGGSIKEQWSIITKYDLENEEHLAFVNRDPRNGKPFGTIHNLVIACANEVFERGDEVKINDCATEDEMLRNKFYYPMKWTLGKGALPVPGENPAGIWKLFRYGKEGRVNETSFYLPIDGGKRIDWSMIENTQIEHMPVFKVDNITIASGRPTIKIEMASSVIHNISSSRSNNIQEDTIKEVVAKDPLMEARLREQIRQLEEALAATKVANNATATVANPVPANLTPQQEENKDVPEIKIVEKPVIPGISEISSEMTQPQTKTETDTLPLPPPITDLKSALNSSAGTVSFPPGFPNVSLPF